MKWRALAAFALLALSGLVAWWWLDAGTPLPEAPVAAELRNPTAQEVHALQMEADRSCRCAREEGANASGQDCWGRFERQLAEFDHNQMSSACMAASSTSVCFESVDGGNDCISKVRPFGACSDQELRQRPEAQATC